MHKKMHKRCTIFLHKEQKVISIILIFFKNNLYYFDIIYLI